MKIFKKISRRAVLSVVGVTLSGIMASTAMAGQFDGVTLRLGTWGGSWKANIVERIVPRFEALGGKIEFVTGSPQANLAAVVAARGRAPFDVMEIMDAQVDSVIKGDFIQKIDLSKIPNKQYIAPYQYNENLVGSWHTQEVICYNKDKYAELGLPAPKTYADLVRPELAGRLTFPDINSGGGLANFSAVVYAAGGDINNVKPGLELINKMKILKFWSRGGETLAQFKTGDIYAAVTNGGWCLRTKKAGVNVTSVHPYINSEHTGVAKVGWLGIMKNSENVDAAHWYINEYLDETFQLLFAKKSGIVPLNKGAIARMGEDPVITEILVLDPVAISKELRIDYSKVDIASWTDQWNRMVTK